jgi:Domain of unknown function (DUF4157)
MSKTGMRRTAAVTKASVPAPPIVHEVVNTSGCELDSRTRSFFEARFARFVPRRSSVNRTPSRGGELALANPADPSEREADRASEAVLTPPAASGPLPDFSRIRIHTGERAARSARAVGALAYAVGPHIVFAQGAYSPSTSRGQQLLAHELAHSVQHISRPAHSHVVRRKIDAAELPKKSAAEIMGDETYMDNEIERLEYHAGELAYVFYKDGSKLELGLIPEMIKPPFGGIDYRTLRKEHISVEPLKPGTYRYIPGGAAMRQVPKGMGWSEVIGRLAQEATFAIEPRSRRIVPTHVNSLTAPMVCELLRISDTKYGEHMDEISRGGVKIFSAFRIVLEIAGVLQGVTEVAGAAAARAAVSPALALQRRATPQIARYFARLLASRGAGEFVVEGFGFGSVRVARVGTELVVERASMARITAGAFTGRAVHRAYEQAAMEVGKQTGAKSVRVLLGPFTNLSWRAYFESIGYRWQVLSYAEVGLQGVGWVNRLTKVFIP